MSRYIDADHLRKWILSWWERTEPTSECLKGRDILNQIDREPSIDIVRCQDCKHWVHNFNGCARNPCTEPWYATDFCNYGERKESE